MPSRKGTSGRSEGAYLLLLSALSLLVPLALYRLRFLDDNRLTSWRWVFGHVDPLPVFLAVAGGIAAAFFLSRLRLPGPGLLFVVSFAVGAVFWPEPEVLVDASRYFTQAKHLSVYGPGYFLAQWGRGIEAWTDLPLVPFLYGWGFRVFGEHRAVVQAMGAAMFAGTVSLTALIGRELWDEKVGDAAGLLLLASPYLLTQVPLMLVDVPSMFFLTLALYLALRALDRGGPLWVVLSALGILTALLSKYSLWLMLTVMAPVFLVAAWKRPWPAARRAFLIGAVVLGGAGAFFLFYRGVVLGQMDLLMHFQRRGLTWWTESYVSTFLFQTHPYVSIAALYSVFVALRNRDGRYLVAAWLPALILLAQVQRSRYTIPVLPMLTLLAAYGLADVGTERLRRFIVHAAIFASVSLGALGFLPFLEKNDMVNLKLAGHALDSLKGRAVRVFTLPQQSMVNPAVAVPLLDLYTRKDILYDYVPAPPVAEGRILSSPLRFTWTYRNPPYYKDGAGRMPLLAVITPGGVEPVEQRLEAYELINKFNVSSGLYRFRPYVRIYRLKLPH
jgi:hypothetical protein